MSWSWIILVVIIQLASQILRPKSFGRGKYLTMPMRRKFPKMFNHVYCRLVQVFWALIIDWTIAMFWDGVIYVYVITLVALSIDDYFSDDDDKKRFKSWARNKIKWKMELPKPIRVEGNTL